MPTFAEYVPVVSGAVTAGTRWEPPGIWLVLEPRHRPLGRPPLRVPVTAVSCLCNIGSAGRRDTAMGYALVMTPQVRAWLHDLRHRDRASAILAGQAIGMLLEADPELGRPLASWRGYLSAGAGVDPRLICRSPAGHLAAFPSARPSRRGQARWWRARQDA